MDSKFVELMVRMSQAAQLPIDLQPINPALLAQPKRYPNEQEYAESLLGEPLPEEDLW